MILKSYFIFGVLLLFGCKNTTSQTNLYCEREINLDDTSICLPAFENMSECYLNPEIKELVDFSIPNGSLALGYYLNDETYKHFKKISNETGLDDYLLVFSTDVLIKQKLTRSQFNAFKNFDEQIKKDWSSLKKIIEEKIKFLNFDQPVVIENYSINDNVFTSVFMSRIQGDDNDYVNITISNSIYIKEKIIITAYNKRYDDLETVKKAKAKNDYFALRFIQDNE